MEDSILEIAFSNVLEELKEVKQEQQKTIATLLLEFDTLPGVHPLKPFTGAGCSSNFKNFVGRKLFVNIVNSLYFRGLWLFYVRRKRKAEPT